MDKSHKYETLSRVEQLAIARTGEELRYSPTEKTNVIIVDNFPELGKLTAFRFLEWAQNNEGWTVSLPTGKTPEHFIKWVSRLLSEWDNAPIQKLLEENGVDPARKPNMKTFHFVQIDEFYPVNTQQHNSFYYYVNKLYIKKFGFDPRKALLINPNEIGIPENETLETIWPDNKVDLELRIRQPKTAHEEKQKCVLEGVDQFCTDYEKRIRALGGIGFFLGGIGPDGHIGFNVRGSDHYSTTRLTPTNYETQAAAATDLGGIEVSRNRLVITIGLQTIVFNPESVAIIIASGEAKAKIVFDAIQKQKDNQYPATVLQSLKHSAFYLTTGAAKLLSERRYRQIIKQDEISEEDTNKILIDLAIEKRKRLVSLSRKDFESIRSSNELYKRSKDTIKTKLNDLELQLQQRFTSTLEIPKNKRFLHTAPHHDDIMLGYLPYLVRLIREQSNVHYFNYLTSGFTAVSNNYVLKVLKNLRWFLTRSNFTELVGTNYFEPSNLVARNRDVWLYLDGVAANNHLAKEEAESRRLMRNLIETFEEDSIDNLENRVDELVNYFETQYPGKKDLPYIQQLKGMIREWEADLLWGYFGFSCSSVIHTRLGFYKGDIFTEDPTHERDILPILTNLEKINPDIVSVAFDPESSGPDTHYKVLQAVAEALKIYRSKNKKKNIEVWGYRNVWFRFHPEEANAYVPVTLNTFAILENAFMNCFGSQAEASFPSYEHDGPFSELAQKVQVEQYQMLKTLLGRAFFYESEDSRTRSTRGVVYLKKMPLDEFFERTSQIKKSTENR
ncbi:MAG: glucosamine-6-phosphate deaminase [Calditrichales bacterium]|nr:MAG: glucosamine-6-phosphate deaminase [Calditrichales bacterium]